MKSQSPNISWCKLNRNFFGFKSDIFLANVYLPPLQSQKKINEDDMLILENEVRKYSNLGDVILAGDFNARTGLLNDYIENDSFDNQYLDNYDIDQTFPKRNNSDLKINKLGEEIVQLCISNKLRILNGRKTGDLNGKITSYQRLGSSTIDYGIVDEKLWKDILAFEIESLTPYSDHCPISLKLATKLYQPENKNKSKKNKKHVNTNNNHRIGYTWKNTSGEDFKSALNHDKIKTMFKSFLSNEYESSFEEVKEFNSIILETAKISLKRKQIPKKKQGSQTKWFDADCSNLKKRLQDIIKQLNKPQASGNNELRTSYFLIKKQYKKLLKRKHREYKHAITLL